MTVPELIEQFSKYVSNTVVKCGYEIVLASNYFQPTCRRQVGWDAGIHG